MTAYYNEIEPFAAGRLRRLIEKGLIADGEVDERDIRDVTPGELVGYSQCHFFAGIGGWSRALRLAGWPDDRPVWTGSCPCQSFSAAGRGAGFADERHLWPSWFHLIRVCQPSVIFGEQVASKLALSWLDLVFDDLEAEGYACGAADIPACSVGAPHIRSRLWFCGALAHANGSKPGGRLGEEVREGEEVRVRASIDSRNGIETGELADSEHAGQHRPGEDATEPSSNGEEGGVSERGYSGLCEADLRLRVRGNNGLEPRGTVPGVRDDSGGTGIFWHPCVWLPCRDGKHRPTEPSIYPLATGVSGRVARLRATGNSIVPQVAAEFIRESSL